MSIRNYKINKQLCKKYLNMLELLLDDGAKMCRVLYFNILQKVNSEN